MLNEQGRGQGYLTGGEVTPSRPPVKYSVPTPVVVAKLIIDSLLPNKSIN